MAGAADKAREAMIAFLKSGEVKPPTAVTRAPGKDAGAAGLITPGFEEGTLFLKNAAGHVFRLEWGKEDGKTSPDRRRALPAGEYSLTGYRLVRRDAKGVEWFLGASGMELRQLTIAAGKEERIAVDEAIHLTASAKAGKDEVKIHAKIAGEKGCGLTIYRGGKRIDLAYRLADAAGKELAAGLMAYG
jgi:hypothetical protein